MTRHATQSAKRAKCAGKGALSTAHHEAPAAVVANNGCGADDVASIFSALRSAQKGKPSKVQSSSAAGMTSGARRVLHKDTEKIAQSRKLQDGLYRAGEKTISMSDADFFAGTTPSDALGPGKTRTSRKHRASSILIHASAKEQSRLREEGVDRIVTEKEMRRMTSTSKRAGTTPNCPFDCDCCF